MDLMKNFIEKNMPEKAAPDVTVGDTVRVHLRVKEGNRERIQVFKGTVIAKKHGGINETFTVRRISYGVGVEKVFPLYSPVIEKVETVRKVRSAGPSCTICATAWARRQRSRRSCNSNEFPKGERSGAPFVGRGPAGKPGSRGVFPGGFPAFLWKSLFRTGKVVYTNQL